MNPMSLRFPLWDPNAFLNRFQPLIDLLWSRLGAALWLAVVLPALLILPPHWTELTGNFSDRVLAVDNLMMLWLVFPAIKLLHELGHAAATKRGGGEVHDLGMMMLVLVPVPYVDATASTVFKSKVERAMVSAAGMAVELFVAALAFYAWLLVEPGAVRSILFNVMFVAGVSTLIFNGNPLLRYDGYYILADLIESPNLAQRATRQWAYVIERYGFGVEGLIEPDAKGSERAWLLLYGAASTAYRIFVSISVALFIAGQFFFIGVVLAIWALIAMTVMPVVKALKHLSDSPTLYQNRRRAVTVSAGVLSALLFVLFVIPLPYRTAAEGVLWLPDEALVRPGQEGFVEQLNVQPGSPVRKGDVLATLHDAPLSADLASAQARLEELTVSYNAQLLSDRAAAGILHEQIEGQTKSMAVLQARADKLVLKAGTDGHFVIARGVDMQGRYLHKGELLGYVIGPQKTAGLVRVVVGQDAADAVRNDTQRVDLRLAHVPEQTLTGRITREVPGGDEYLPSKVLSIEGGGHLVTDAREPNRPKTLERTFQFDVALPDQAAAKSAYFGERAFVSIRHTALPIGIQWYRAARLLLLSHFNV
jgi:putative peptide zinc metalloprotease protein